MKTGQNLFIHHNSSQLPHSYTILEFADEDSSQFFSSPLAGED